MIYLFVFIFILLLILISVFFVLGYKKYTHIANKNHQISQENTQLMIQNEVLRDQVSLYQNQINALKQDHQENIQNLEKTHQKNLDALENRLKEHYKNQNELLFSQNKNELQADSKKILDDIFSPLKEQIKSYTERLTQNEVKLETQIKSMFTYSQNLEENANKLALVLKGDKKIRGNFGEIQLKSVLQNSGLIEGEQFKLQESFKQDGSRYVPDAIIYLEKDKSIVIDAKFSLPNDFNFNEISQEVCQQISKNLISRIDELSKKPYSTEVNYDYVLLFIPYQNILDLALQENPNLYQYAYTKKIYLTTPYTLFMALKTISITWINYQRNENVIKAFDEIDKFYKKFQGALVNLNDLETHFERTIKAKEALKNKLIEGNGNLQSRFEQLGVLSEKLKNHHSKLQK